MLKNPDGTETFVPGKVVETKNGPKFVSGQVIQTAEGEKFLPGVVVNDPEKEGGKVHNRLTLTRPFTKLNITKHPDIPLDMRLQKVKLWSVCMQVKI